MTTREYLRQCMFSREMVDRFLDSQSNCWARFDPELGYVGNDCICKDGIDDSTTVYSYEPSGCRKRVNYPSNPCRINTYGNSMTHCHQVSDGETWQEYLAAHLHEPVRNYGMGGYGVYQTYRRMLRHEASADHAPFVIFGIYPDDHRRSLFMCRYLHRDSMHEELRRTVSDSNVGFMFHGNPWVHVRLNLESGEIEECENPFATPESLYRLCDMDYFCQTFEHQLDVQVLLAINQVPDIDTALLKRAAEILQVTPLFGTPADAASTARTLFDKCSVQASKFIIDKAALHAARNGSKLLVALSCLAGQLRCAMQGEPRFDQAFLDYLKERGILHFDATQAHLEELKTMGCSLEDYLRLYFIGHYNPRGNHFFAFAFKDAIVRWLNPKPEAYRKHMTSGKKLAATFV